jgi:hypothetical protein
MFVKITNGKVDKYPYSIGDLRRDNPNTSFPKNIPNETLAGHNVFPVDYEPAPEFNPMTHRVQSSDVPVNRDGKWILAKTVVPLTQEQIDSRNAGKASEVRQERNKRIADCDWTQVEDSPVDKALWATYRQSLRDIPQQAGFPWDIQWPEMP